ncbi:MAG: F0F1 ATP synthase subunit B [Limnochordaceae bacterium]|nr:F0F1 ATP synthase subunit B [Limnochordaceae bacterium]
MTLGPVHLDPWTFLFQVINVLIVMMLLKKFLFQPVAGMIEKREATIRQHLENAKRSQDEAQQLLTEYQGKLEEAHQQAQAIIQQATVDGERLRQQQRQEAERQAQALLASARREIQQEKQRAMGELRDQAVQLAILASEQLLRRQWSAADQHRLVAEVAEQLAKERRESEASQSEKVEALS